MSRCSSFIVFLSQGSNHPSTFMNIQEALAYGRSQLSTSPTPAIDARLLLQYVLQVDHSYLVAHYNTLLTASQQQQYRHLLNRARQREPIPYLIGVAPFYGLDFVVNPAVLIPRPETEQLVELALSWARPRQSLRIVDVGTGSGCIAVTLAVHLPDAQIEATDSSADALAIARQNAQHYAPGRIRFYQGHLLAPLVQKPDLIVANLPYVTDKEWTMLDDGVKLYEPVTALKGGADGLDLIRELLRQATTQLNPGGAVFLEIGWRQGPTAQHLAQSFFPNAQIEVKADFAGHDRFVIIQLLPVR